jgi:hypothetical protein
MEEQPKNSLLSMLDIILSDIEALEKVALEAAEEDTIKAFESRDLEIPTTQPLGAVYQFKTQTILKSRLTIPLTMVCFSIIDLVGKLVEEKAEQLAVGKQAGKSDSKEGSMERDGFLSHAQIFFKQLAKRDELKNDLSARRLQDAFRHSIAHAFLPGATQSVGYQVSYSQALDGYSLFFENHHGITLNVKLLTEITKNGINGLKNLLNVPQNGDLKNMADRIIRNFAGEIQDNHDRLKYLDKK